MKMENIFAVLKTAIDSNSGHDVVNNLKLLLDQSTKIKINNDVGIINNLLKIDTKEVQTLTAEIVAELAKDEDNRKSLTNEEVINKLMSFLQIQDNNLLLTTIRALGNICYENIEACNIVDQTGINSILDVLRQDPERKDNLLTTKASGLLVNLLNTHENLSRTALKSGILQLVESLFERYSEPTEQNQVLIIFLLSVLNCLSDYLDEQTYIFSEKLGGSLVKIFKKSENPEISVLCLEIFHGQSEKEEIKSLLAKEGICELLYELIEKYKHKVNDEDSRSVLKIACDLIVIILTGDFCMYLLYDNGNGKTYNNMRTWLDSEDSDLLSTGILAIGNFARKDTHCIHMVKNGISKKLIDILSKYNHSADINDVKIQHALLSTLKNLVIPKENKKQVLEENLIEVMYPMIKIDRYMVVFKLLGTFRMVIDGQECASLELLSKPEFIERLVYWCYNSDHLGVRGEVPRLLSWLIKNCHSFAPFEKFVSVKDSVKCIVEMISSNHGVMQNEAFYSLNLLSLGLSSSEKDKSTEESEKSDVKSEKLDKFYDDLIDADIGKNLNFVMNKYGDKWEAHTIENLLTVLEHITNSEKVVNHLQSSNITESLAKLAKNSNATNLVERVNKLLIKMAK